MVTTGRMLPWVGIILWTMTVAAHAQTASAELDVTGGYSGEEIRAAAAQRRVFGNTGSHAAIQYFAEAAWGRRWAGGDPIVGGALTGADPLGTDVFGSMGSRVRLAGDVTAQINYMHQHGDLPRIKDNSVDVTLTYSVRYR